ESRTSRWPGNYGNFPKAVGGDTDITWTWSSESAPEAVRKWEEQSDPVLLYARKLLDRKAINRESLLDLDARVRREVDAAAKFALDSPLPPAEAAVEYAYA
ncbi:MAG TPA: hypothetical protein VF157_00065, partial [Chloroflexota bacterium]